MTKIESEYKEMMEDVQMSDGMIAHAMAQKALELEGERDEAETTFTLRHRLASENPRVIEYCYSDRPDEIFTDHKLLQKHRGLTDEQVQQTITIYEQTIMTKIESEYKEMMEDVQMSDGMIAHAMALKALELDELTTVTEQRDRLAEALRGVLRATGCCPSDRPESHQLAKYKNALIALQSLTNNQ
jgi:hypothetical protein